MDPNICGSSIRNYLAPRILRWLVDFCKSFLSFLTHMFPKQNFVYNSQQTVHLKQIHQALDTPFRAFSPNCCRVGLVHSSCIFVYDCGRMSFKIEVDLISSQSAESEILGRNAGKGLKLLTGLRTSLHVCCISLLTPTSHHE